jgi:ABC-2 type transport system permease protein
MVFAWLERWLAQRKTREILGVLFIGAILCIQLVGPMLRRYEHGNRMQLLRLVAEITPVERMLPPVLAAEAIAHSLEGNLGAGFLYFSVLGGYWAVAILLLSVRVRQEYRGENLSETGPRGAAAPVRQRTDSWVLPDFSVPTALVMEKELRYLSRSGPMLFTLIVPLFMLLIFRSNGAFPHHRPDLVFPAVAAYTLILLTNLIYNNFGGDGSGIQFYFAAPITFREIVAGKNLAHTLILLLEIVIAWAGVSWMYKPPTADVMAATLAAVLFAAPVNLATGNLLSLYFPKRIEASAFGRQRASPTTVLASFGVQFVVIGTAALVLWLTRGISYWTATAIFLVLAAFSLAGYTRVLGRVDRVALARRENLVSELLRA